VYIDVRLPISNILNHFRLFLKLPVVKVDSNYKLKVANALRLIVRNLCNKLLINTKYSETCIRRNRMGPKIFSTLDKFPHYTK
jgi:hypothetical protein